MIEKTRAIVLHVTEYAEASIIVKAYTDLHGLQSFLVNGVRKSKSRFAPNLFRPLSLIELVAYYKKQGGLNRVSEVSASPILNSIPYDTVKTGMALFMSEILYRSIREEETNAELFHFIDHSVQMLDLHTTTVSRFHLSFMLQLTRYLGFYPSGNYNESNGFFDLQEGRFVDAAPLHHPFYLSKEMGKLLNELLSFSLEEVSTFKISAPERKQLLAALVLYYELHMTSGSKIKSHEVMMELF
jgi:DNA repair protein RecO (recombination protein O)